MVSVNKEKCIGCGACEATCPEVFEMKDDMKAYVKKGKENAKGKKVEEAIEFCAVDAITS